MLRTQRACLPFCRAQGPKDVNSDCRRLWEFDAIKEIVSLTQQCWNFNIKVQQPNSPHNKLPVSVWGRLSHLQVEKLFGLWIVSSSVPPKITFKSFMRNIQIIQQADEIMNLCVPSIQSEWPQHSSESTHGKPRLSCFKPLYCHFTWKQQVHTEKETCKLKCRRAEMQMSVISKGFCDEPLCPNWFFVLFLMLHADSIY